MSESAVTTKSKLGQLASVDETHAEAELAYDIERKDDEKQSEMIETSKTLPNSMLSPTDNHQLNAKTVSSPNLTHTTLQRRRRMSITQQAVNLERNAAAGAEDFAGLSETQIVKMSRKLDDSYIDEIRKSADKSEFKLGDVLEYLGSGMSVIVEDDFSACFERSEQRPWNWNVYLFLFWIIGLILRYFILFPFRLLIQILAILLCLLQLWIWGQLFAKNPKKREAWEIWSIQFLAQMWMFAWFGVLEFDGVIPQRRPNQIYVANHTTMLDYLILLSMKPFCVVGQLHSSKPLIAWFQLDLLKSLNCIWFDRQEQKNRELAMKRIKDHVTASDKPRLLIFPEGTCVNNEYCIQFKKGTFGLGVEVCPIAIKYDKTFVDAYWISRERPFHWHVFDIMTSWAMVCKITYLEPQKIQPNETDAEFASRVKAMIAKSAGLKNVEWNGYLKHYRPSDRIINEKKKVFAARLERAYATIGKGNDESQLRHRKN